MAKFKICALTLSGAARELPDQQARHTHLQPIYPIIYNYQTRACALNGIGLYLPALG